MPCQVAIYLSDSDNRQVDCDGWVADFALDGAIIVGVRETVLVTGDLCTSKRIFSAALPGVIAT